MNRRDEPDRPSSREAEVSAEELDEVSGGVQDTIIINTMCPCGELNTVPGCGTQSPSVT